jgi:hypothetical protein
MPTEAVMGEILTEKFPVRRSIQLTGQPVRMARPQPLGGKLRPPTSPLASRETDGSGHESKSRAELLFQERERPQLLARAEAARDQLGCQRQGAVTCSKNALNRFEFKSTICYGGTAPAALG